MLVGGSEETLQERAVAPVEKPAGDRSIGEVLPGSEAARVSMFQVSPSGPVKPKSRTICCRGG
jgi:hypothetical protein